MLHKFMVGALASVAIALGGAALAQGQFGTAAEAKAMLEKAVAELKSNEAAALAKFTYAARSFRAAVTPALRSHDAQAAKNTRYSRSWTRSTLTPVIRPFFITAPTNASIAAWLSVCRPFSSRYAMPP